MAARENPQEGGKTGRASSFYVPGPDLHFQATSATVGPWGPAHQHGSPPAALLVRTLEHALPRPDARVGRVAFDFFGPVAVGEVALEVEVVRPGARIELARAKLSAGGRLAMQASVWRIAAAAGRAPAMVPPFEVPAVPATPTTQLFGDVPSFGYGEALEWRFVEGAFDRKGPATAWSRPKVPLLEGEPLSPLSRVLLMVDSANGISAELEPSRYTFVPVELSVALHRHPRTEWVGMRARTTIEGDGIGLVRAELFDQEGALGSALQTLFVAPRGGVGAQGGGAVPR
jgi:hypothetical protein